MAQIKAAAAVSQFPVNGEADFSSVSKPVQTEAPDGFESKSVLRLGGGRSLGLEHPGPWARYQKLYDAFQAIPSRGGGPADIRLLSDNIDAWVGRYIAARETQKSIDMSY